MEFPRVAVVIINWNGKHFLEKFLPSVYNSSYPNLEIIIGDNASTDTSLDFVRQYFPSMRIISNDENYGFAGGYNRVLSQVDAEYLILLNSDAEVTAGWIEPVVSMMQKDAKIAVAQPKIRSYYEKNKFEYAGAAGGFLDSYGYPFCRGRIFDTLETDNGQYDEEGEIFWATGAALFIKKHCWDEVNGMDADFFAHMEEIDMCWRLKNRGYKIMYCPDSIVYHVGAGTLNSDSSYKTYLNFRNNLAMIKKNLPAGKAIFILFIRFWLDFVTLIQYLVKGKFANARAINKAHTHFIRDIKKNYSKQERSLSAFNSAGLYKGSIVWNYFVLGRKRFSDIFK